MVYLIRAIVYYEFTDGPEWPVCVHATEEGAIELCEKLNKLAQELKSAYSPEKYKELKDIDNMFIPGENPVYEYETVDFYA